MTRFVVIFCLILAIVAAAPKRKKPTQSDGKIVGGKDTDINAVPYQVSLQYRNRHICGGSIIGPRHVLTAAHCVERGRASDYSIRAGSNYHAGGGETRRVSKVTRHPNYNPSTVNNDAAVLELSEPISSNTAARMVPLAESEPRSGDQVLVSGWGATREGGTAHRNLQSVTVPAITRQTCQRVYVRYNTITENMFCAGYMNGGRDACQGDSGGPAIVNGRQAGIVSWGAGCARRNAPGVYTNVASIRPWIVQQTRATRKGLGKRPAVPAMENAKCFLRKSFSDNCGPRSNGATAPDKVQPYLRFPHSAICGINGELDRILEKRTDLGEFKRRAYVMTRDISMVGNVPIPSQPSWKIPTILSL